MMFDKLVALEFNSPANALHYNDGEKGYTFMGIYQYAHPNWECWGKILEAVEKHGMVKASAILYYDKELLVKVMEFYKSKFWDKMRLDEVKEQKIANEMMVFAVNAGIPIAVKTAQEIVGAVVDGVLGSKTIAALNEYPADKFDIEFDKLEIRYYEKLAAANEKYVRYLKGWRNRAIAV